MAPVPDPGSRALEFTSTWDLGGPVDQFHPQHPVLFVLAAVFYLFPVAAGLLALVCCIRPQDAVHPIFLTDGVLICCCPVAAVLPVVLWPLWLLGHALAYVARRARAGLAFVARWYRSAPTFCGVRRHKIRPYAAHIVRPLVKGAHGAWRGVRGLLCNRGAKTVAAPRRPANGRGLSSTAGRGYGTINASTSPSPPRYDPRADDGHSQYLRPPPMRADVYPARSAPPPYSP